MANAHAYKVSKLTFSASSSSTRATCLAYSDICTLRLSCSSNASCSCWWIACKKKTNEIKIIISLWKQPRFRDATTVFPTKWRLRNERRNSILMTCHCPDLGSASDWWKQFFNQSQHYPDLDSYASSAWNFCARSSDVISRENQWWLRKISAAYSSLNSYGANLVSPEILNPTTISKIQLVVYYQCCVLIGWATTRLYVIAH